jgi:hypothetical protein
MMQDNPAVARLKARFDPERPELDAMRAVVDPRPARLDELAGRDHRRMADEGDEIALAAGFDTQNAEPVLGVVECDPVDQPSQDLGRGARPRRLRHPGMMEIKILGRYRDQTGTASPTDAGRRPPIAPPSFRRKVSSDRKCLLRRRRKSPESRQSISGRGALLAERSSPARDTVASETTSSQAKFLVRVCPTAVSSSHLTPRWRKQDSNPRSLSGLRVRGTSVAVMGIRGRAGASHRVGRAGTRDRVRWPRCHAYDDRRPASAIGTAMVRQVEVLWCSLTMMSSPTSVLRNRNFDPKISHRLLNRYLGNRSSSARRDSALFEHRTDV